MNLKIKNTLSGQYEKFKPINKKQISMYHCGPTVYKPAHIGNLRPYIFADFLRRFFKYHNYKVKQVINITDVGHLTSDNDEGEDKIEQEAKERGLKAKQITENITLKFFQDLEKLNIDLTQIIFPRATQYINEQIDAILELERAGLTYKINDGIYFDTGKIKNYGKLGQVDLDQNSKMARIEKNSEKKSKNDFALWKFSDPNIKREQEWQSPWGIGFPGWHIECSTMIKKILGQPIDIHTGGIEHIPTHHNNEIAQSESIGNKKLSKYWVHLNHVLINGQKMSKSLGNILLLKEIENPIAYRYWVLTAHHSSIINFTNESISGANIAFKKIVNFIQENKKGKINKKYFKKFLHHLENDFDTPQAIATIWLLLKDPNIQNHDKKTTILEMDKILGFNFENFIEEKVNIPEEIMSLIKSRQIAREQKNWQKSDEIRQEVEKMGYKIIDQQNTYKIEKNDATKS
jgi:cysteinyl-tRNA synthetase